MPSNDPQIVFNVPREIIDAHVKAAVASTLNKDPGTLVAKIVEAAMQERGNAYDGSTIWSRKVNEMIREVATEAFQAWLNEQRPLIAKVVRDKLAARNSKAFVDEVAGKLTAALGQFHVSIHLPG